MSTLRHCDGCGANADFSAAARFSPRGCLPGHLRIVGGAEEAPEPQWLTVNVGAFVPGSSLDFCSAKCAAATIEKAITEASARASKAENDFVKFAGRFEPTRMP